MNHTISVVIPTIPPRANLLTRAVSSVSSQFLSPEAVIIPQDTRKLGAAANRQAGLDLVKTGWVAFLDDDDEFYPQHLQNLLEHALTTGADYVYSWYDVIGGTDPMPQHFGVPFDPQNPVQTTVTTLVRTELAQSVRYRCGSQADPNGTGLQVAGEDYRFTLGCVQAGAVISHLPERTWAWHHHASNTSGLPERW